MSSTPIYTSNFQSNPVDTTTEGASILKTTQFTKTYFIGAGPSCYKVMEELPCIQEEGSIDEISNWTQEGLRNSVLTGGSVTPQSQTSSSPVRVLSPTLFSFRHRLVATPPYLPSCAVSEEILEKLRELKNVPSDICIIASDEIGDTIQLTWDATGTMQQHSVISGKLEVASDEFQYLTAQEVLESYGTRSSPTLS